MNNNIQYMITDCLSQCTYFPYSKNYIEQAVMDAITFSEKPSKLDIFQLGTDKIILAIVPLGICFHNRKFDVSVKVFFMKNIPNEPPQFFLLITPKTAVNPRNLDIDPNTYRIIVPSLRNWNPVSSIRKVLEEITISFTKTFPLYQKSEASSTHNPSMISQSYLDLRQYLRTVVPTNNQQASYGNAQMPAKPSNSAVGMYSVQETYENQLKLALIESCLDKVTCPVMKEKKSLEQQNGKINNYKTQFNNEMQKISSFMNNVQNIFNYLQYETHKINNEIAKVKATPVEQPVETVEKVEPVEKVATVVTTIVVVH